MMHSVSGEQVTSLGLGGAWLGWTPGSYDIDRGVATVLTALDLGIRLIDTSASYIRGESERIIGRAIGEWIGSGGNREDLLISTKTGTRIQPKTDASYSGEATRRSIEASLEALDVEYLDVALVHDPPDYTVTLRDGYAWETLQDLKERGMVRYIGLGYREHKAHQAYISTGCCDVCLTHNDYNLISRTALAGVLKPAAEARVEVFNASPTAGGFLTGQDPRTELERRLTAIERQKIARPDLIRVFTERSESAMALYQWSRDIGIDLNALNLQFSMRQPLITATLFGATDPDIVRTNFKASRVEIPDSIWRELRKFLSLSSEEIPFIDGDDAV